MKPRPTHLISSRRARRFSVAALVSGVMLAVVAPAALAGAAPRPIVFDYLQLGSQCVYVTAPAGVAVELVWKSAGGALKLRETQVAGEFGDLYYCSSSESTVLAIGDRLKANDGSTIRKLRVPVLTIDVDRVLNKIYGSAPAGGNLRLECGGGPLPSFEPCQWRKRVTATSAGKWSSNVPWDVQGGELMLVRWRSAAGDIVYATAVTPHVIITLGKARFSGATGAGQAAHPTLADPTTHEIKASASVIGGPSGRFTGKFRDSAGQAVAVSAGDELDGYVATDADMIVPQIDATASASSNVVSGRCFDTGRSERTLFLQLLRAGERAGWALEGTEDDGSFSVDMLQDGVGFRDPVDIEAGDTVLVTCVQMGGDWVQREIAPGP